MHLLLHNHVSWEGVVCVCSRAALQDTYLLNKGMKGKLVEEEEVGEVKVGRSVSFDLGAEGDVEDKISEALEDPWKDLHAAGSHSQGSTTILVDQPAIETSPQEDFDIPFREDALKMKEMGLPLGFNNVSPYEVEEGGAVVETQMKERLTKGKRRGKKKKKQQAVDEETKERFDVEWWVIHGQAKVMQVWKERYGRFMDDQEEEVPDDQEEENQSWQEYEEQGKTQDVAVESEEKETSGPSPEQAGGWGTTIPLKGENGAGGEVGWGQAPPPSTTASGWGEVVSAPTVASSTNKLGENESGGRGGWGDGGAHQGGAVWGDTWGGGEVEGGGQADWDALWIEVTNEVYKAEMAKWMHEGEKLLNQVRPDGDVECHDGVKDIEENLAQVKLEKAVEDPINTQEVEQTVENQDEERLLTKDNKKDEGKVKGSKANSGLAGVLRHLQHSEDGGFTVAEGDMNNENDDDEGEGPEELKVEREATGLDQALRAFGQLGYVFEPEAGARWKGTPGVRYARIFLYSTYSSVIPQKCGFELEVKKCREKISPDESEQESLPAFQDHF